MIRYNCQEAVAPNTNTVIAHNAPSEKHLTPEAGESGNIPYASQESSTIPGPLQPYRGPWAGELGEGLTL